MKKFLQFLGGVAVAATVIPYSYSRDEESGEQNFQALLWKANVRSQVEEGEKKLSITLGFNNPFQAAPADEEIYEDETGLFAEDEPAVDYCPVCECACDEECAELNDCCPAAEETADEAGETPAEAGEESEDQPDPAE